LTPTPVPTATIRGDYYDGVSSAAHPVSLTLSDQGELTMQPPLTVPVAINQVVISSQIGSTPRAIRFANGGLLESHDHGVIDQWLVDHQPRAGWIHQFESHIGYVIGALVLLVALVGATATWGIPWASGLIAQRLPVEMTRNIGDKALESMDQFVLRPTALPEDSRQRLTQKFQRLLPTSGDPLAYRLEFRQGGAIWANAFAFPNGTIVMTDELVELAEVDDELLSILLHEIGHLEHRHSLRQIISHSSLAILTTVLTGDISAAGALVVAAPNVMMESSYSRAMETEADTYSLTHMPELGLDPKHFANIMERLELAASDETAAANNPAVGDSATWQADECPEDSADREIRLPEWLGFFSSHPLTAERIARFRSTPPGQSDHRIVPSR
jgi:Zn-dependent protease with chaperone function